MMVVEKCWEILASTEAVMTVGKYLEGLVSAGVINLWLGLNTARGNRINHNISFYTVSCEWEIFMFISQTIVPVLQNLFIFGRGAEAPNKAKNIYIVHSFMLLTTKVFSLQFNLRVFVSKICFSCLPSVCVLSQ